MKIIGEYKTALGTKTTYSYYADDFFEAEERGKEVAKTFGWQLLTLA